MDRRSALALLAESPINCCCWTSSDWKLVDSVWGSWLTDFLLTELDSKYSLICSNSRAHLNRRRLTLTRKKIAEISSDAQINGDDLLVWLVCEIDDSACADWDCRSADKVTKNCENTAWHSSGFCSDSDEILGFIESSNF